MRVHISQHKQHATHHVFYVTCDTPDTYHHMRNIITQHTTLVTADTHVRYMSGKVTSLPHYMSTSDIMSHINQYAPNVTSLVITCVASIPTVTSTCACVLLHSRWRIEVHPTTTWSANTTQMVQIHSSSNNRVFPLLHCRPRTV